MTTNESKAQNPESSVQIRLWDAEISICSNANGDIEVSGERNDVVGIVTHYIHEKLLVRGRTRSDALRVAREITKEFDAEMVNFEGVREIFEMRGSSFSKQISLVKLPNATDKGCMSSRRGGGLPSW